MNDIRQLLADALRPTIAGDGMAKDFALANMADALLADSTLAAILDLAEGTARRTPYLASPEVRALLADWRAMR